MSGSFYRPGFDGAKEDVMGYYCDLFVDDLTRRGMATNTIDTYVRCVRNLIKHYMRPPDELSPDDIKAFQLHLTKERKVASSTFNLYTHAIRFFFMKTLQKDWKINFFPYHRKGRALPEILNAQELNALFEAAKNLKHKAMLMTTYSAGLRVSELVHLQVSDIDSQRMMIRVDQGKGRKDRYVPLSANLLPVLREYWKVCRTPDWLFQGQDRSKPLSVKSAQRTFTITQKKVGITKRVSMHSLRHAFATHLMESGVDIRTIQRLLGHRSLYSTMIYTHVAKNYVTQAGSPLDKLNKRLEELLPLSDS